jgi:hypothetical protein
MEIIIATAIAFTIMVGILGTIDMAIQLFCKKCDKSKPKAGNLL